MSIQGCKTHSRRATISLVQIPAITSLILVEAIGPGSTYFCEPDPRLDASSLITFLKMHHTRQSAWFHYGSS